MARVARSKFLVLRFHEEITFNAQAFLEGKLELFSNSRLTVYSALVKRDVDLAVEEIPWLLSLPESQWKDVSEIRGYFSEGDLSDDAPSSDAPSDDHLSGDGFPGDERFHELIREGVVVYDDEGSPDPALPPEAGPLAERHRLLTEIPWHPTALHVHLRNQDHEHENAEKKESLDLVAMTRDSESRAEKFVDERGEPPPLFFEARTDSPLLELDVAERSGSLYETLARRRTIRAFDRERTVGRETFSSILRYAFGCLGRHPLSPRFVTQHKGSPSGGSLHPIEAYPVISKVDGFEPGFYHYETRRHALRLLSVVEPQVLEERLIQLGQGQVFVAEAHFVVLLVARFPRNFWKYRERINTYNVVLKDSGHLSQTFQLVATESGLGAFYTGAIDPLGILESLGFTAEEDRYLHGPIGILGAGPQSPEDQTLMPLVTHDPVAER